MEEGSEKEHGCCLQFCLGRNSPPALVLLPDTSVLPHISLVPFKVLSPWWSLEGVSLSKSVSAALPQEKPEYLTDPSPTGFYSQKLCGLSSWHWNPGLAGLVWDWDASLLRCHPNLYPPHMGMGPAPVHISLSLPFRPSYPSV